MEKERSAYFNKYIANMRSNERTEAGTKHRVTKKNPQIEVKIPVVNQLVKNGEKTTSLSL